MNKRIALVAGIASITLALGLSGCSTGAETVMSKDSGMISAQDGVAVDPSMGMNLGANTSPMSVQGGASVERSTIETAYLSLTSSAPQDSAGKVHQLVDTAGGFVQDSSWSPANEYAPETAYLTIRVPAASIDSVLTQLSTVGTVDSLSRSRSDVTLQVTDLKARISSLQTSLDNLRTLQAQATNVSDLITVESAIASRQAELDSLVAQQTYLSDQIDLSTISVTITGISGTPTNQTFWDGLVAGWNSLAVAGATIVVALGFVLPWLLILGVIAAVVIVVVIRLVRRSEAASSKPAANKPAANKPVAKKPATKRPATKK